MKVVTATIRRISGDKRRLKDAGKTQDRRPIATGRLSYSYTGAMPLGIEIHKDLAQDIFIKVWTNREKLAEQSDLMLTFFV